MVLQSAFVFIKPHAVTDATKALVKEGFGAKGIKIVTEGSLSAEEIDEKMLIDQHYYSIASKATILDPKELNVPADKFEAQFGLGWTDALSKGVVFNAKQACEKAGIDAEALDAAWAKAKKAKKLVKFGGGFYCGLVDTLDGVDPMYVFNGFFMSMRSKFVAPGVSIYYYVVEWDSNDLSWEDFRGKVLGPTDPADAPADSLRGLVMSNWQKLGLASQPDVGDNGVHASASPFEALAERMNWLGVSMEDDSFGKALLAQGISKKTILEWSVDPQVTYGAACCPLKGSFFDALEDQNSNVCIATMRGIATGTSSIASSQIPTLPLISAFIGGLAVAGLFLKFKK